MNGFSDSSKNKIKDSFSNSFDRKKFDNSKFFPMFFTREMSPINILGHYKGGSIFLISNGPSFADLDHSLLKQPGIMTFGLNNGPATFRPNLWTCVDDPSRFLKSIWVDPLITKFVPQTFFERTIFDNYTWEKSKIRVGECPNIIGYRRNEKFNAESFLYEDTINWGNHKDYGGGRTVFLPALRICHLLGFRTVYLLGVDLNMSKELTYHFDEQRDNGAVKGNMNTYRRMKEEYFPQLKPFFDREDFKVFNCNDKSQLKCFPYFPYEEAIKEATSFIGDVSKERTWGMYCKSEEKIKLKNEKKDEEKENVIAKKKVGKIKSVSEVIHSSKIIEPPRKFDKKKIEVIKNIDIKKEVLKSKEKIVKILGDRKKETVDTNSIYSDFLN